VSLVVYKNLKVLDKRGCSASEQAAELRSGPVMVAKQDRTVLRMVGKIGALETDL